MHVIYRKIAFFFLIYKNYIWRTYARVNVNPDPWIFCFRYPIYDIPKRFSVGCLWEDTLHLRYLKRLCRYYKHRCRSYYRRSITEKTCLINVDLKIGNVLKFYHTLLIYNYECIETSVIILWKQIRPIYIV